MNFCRLHHLLDILPDIPASMCSYLTWEKIPTFPGLGVIAAATVADATNAVGGIVVAVFIAGDDMFTYCVLICIIYWFIL